MVNVEEPTKTSIGQGEKCQHIPQGWSLYFYPFEQTQKLLNFKSEEINRMKNKLRWKKKKIEKPWFEIK